MYDVIFLKESNMSLVATVGDTASGHATSIILDGQSGYSIRGKDIAVVGSTLSPHKQGRVTHNAVITSGSSKYTIRGIPIARVGDAVSCGLAVASGQSNYDLS